MSPTKEHLQGHKAKIKNEKVASTVSMGEVEPGKVSKRQDHSGKESSRSPVSKKREDTSLMGLNDKNVRKRLVKQKRKKKEPVVIVISKKDLEKGEKELKISSKNKDDEQ